MHRAKGLRDLGLLVVRVVDDDRHDERLTVRHVVRAIDRKLPFTPEVALQPRLRRARDDRHEQRAIVDVPPDLPVPGIAAPQLALVEPDLDAGGPERVANVPRGLRILRGVAQEYGLRGLGHRPALVSAKLVKPFESARTRIPWMFFLVSPNSMPHGRSDDLPGGRPGATPGW